jgi:hypothetical protein
MNYWYLSFSNNKIKGACVVAGETLSDAITRSWILDINPGGSVVALPVPEREVNSLPHDRFIPVEELQSYGPVCTWEELLSDARE